MPSPGDILLVPGLSPSFHSLANATSCWSRRVLFFVHHRHSWFMQRAPEVASLLGGLSPTPRCWPFRSKRQNPFVRVCNVSEIRSSACLRSDVWVPSNHGKSGQEDPIPGKPPSLCTPLELVDHWVQAACLSWPLPRAGQAGLLADSAPSFPPSGHLLCCTANKPKVLRFGVHGAPGQLA